MEFKVVETLDELIKTFIVRGIVFMEEQAVPYVIEKDPHEHSALHIIGELDQEPVATARIRFQGDCAKLERMAVRKQWRGQGYGRQLLDYTTATARHQGFKKFKLHAQITAQAFYEKHGFKPVGDIFKEANIEHRLMVKED
jgi:predicted GNAT family N-acyltransferase